MSRICDYKERITTRFSKTGQVYETTRWQDGFIEQVIEYKPLQTWVMRIVDRRPGKRNVKVLNMFECDPPDQDCRPQYIVYRDDDLGEVRLDRRW